MNTFLFFLVVVVLLILLDAAALMWGADSRDGPDSPEWDRRRTWTTYR